MLEIQRVRQTRAYRRSYLSTGENGGESNLSIPGCYASTSDIVSEIITSVKRDISTELGAIREDLLSELSSRKDAQINPIDNRRELIKLSTALADGANIATISSRPTHMDYALSQPTTSPSEPFKPPLYHRHGHYY